MNQLFEQRLTVLRLLDSSMGVMKLEFRSSWLISRYSEMKRPAKEAMKFKPQAMKTRETSP
jgi:hypothetical protein